ncbi:MAG: 4Fe-4S dicluster domain-containing protein [Syntrophales bacterium]
MEGYIEINRERCKACLLCVHACKRGNIVPSKEYNAKGYSPVNFNNDGDQKCTGCALCAITCPEIAIEVYRE